MKASNTGLGAAVLLIHAVAAPTLAAQNTADTQDTSGQQLFEAHCATCHQFDGGGVPMMQPAITGISRANNTKGGVITMILLGSAAIAPEDSVSMNEMPAFAALSDNEIARIATYVRTNFENSGGSVTAADVARIRADIDGSSNTDTQHPR